MGGIFGNSAYLCFYSVTLITDSRLTSFKKHSFIYSTIEFLLL
nr:MAG TPA: hypothetical protein [Caudoviricetes sp.]